MNDLKDGWTIEYTHMHSHIHMHILTYVCIYIYSALREFVCACGLYKSSIMTVINFFPLPHTHTQAYIA